MIPALLIATALVSPEQRKIVGLSESFFLDKKLSEVVKQTGIPAMAAIVVDNGNLRAKAFTGVRRKGNTTKVTAGDLWQLGSVTKVFNKELIRKAVAQGKSSWNTTLAQAFPAYASKMHTQLRGVTIQQVADHKSGLPNTHEGNPGLFIKLPTLSMTRQLHVNMALRIQPPYPADESHYSNFGYVVLGALAENIYKTSWETAIRQELLTPWGVTWVFFGEPSVAIPGQPWPHSSAGDKVTPVSSCKNSLPYNTYAPAGHLSVSVSQADKLMLGYMNGGGPSRSHSGSNGRNYARLSMDSSKKYGYLIVTNCGGDLAVEAATMVEDWIKARMPK